MRTDSNLFIYINILRFFQKKVNRTATGSHLVIQSGSLGENHIMPRAGLEPARGKPTRDFKSLASTNSATPAESEVIIP